MPLSSLSLAGNTLTFTKGDGTTQSIDLTLQAKNRTLAQLQTRLDTLIAGFTQFLPGERIAVKVIAKTDIRVIVSKGDIPSDWWVEK